MKNDSLGDRMKEYEGVTRYKLMGNSYTIIRVDGKAFHTYTKGLVRPFDVGLIKDMDSTAMYLCEKIMGAKLAFVQSDEITIVLTDFDTRETEAWFKGNLQKMCSVSSSMATSKFNQLRIARAINLIGGPDVDRFVLSMPQAEFDARVFQLPSRMEVINNLIWRQQDTVRNSISSVAQSLYSHKELEGVNSNAKQEMIFQKGVNWNDYDPKLKRGRMIVKETYDKDGATRSRWVSVAAPDFLKDKEALDNILP